MSFSSYTKNELVKIKNVSTSAGICELMGAVALGSRIRKGKGGLRVSTVTENPRIARRIFKLMKEYAKITSKISINKRNMKTWLI